MGRISASTGLMSGVDIQGTVTKLMAIEAKPRDALTSANTNLGNQQAAITKLSAYLLSVQFIAKNLGKDSLFTKQTASTSDPNALTATVTGTPAQGTYQYTPVRTAQNQQFLSSNFRSATDALGGGTMTFRYGNSVDHGASLSDLNGGLGFVRGKIRITDRSGASTQIDLSYAQNIDDVLQAINSAGTINVSAKVDGGHIVLTDNTGQGASDLKVQEVGGGSTAASLGLSGIDVATNSASGRTVFVLGSNISLSALNDGAGVDQSSTGQTDFNYTLADGTTGQIHLATNTTSSEGVVTTKKATTLGEVIQAINTQSGGKLTASIANSGDHLVLTDSSGGNGTLQLTASANSTALHDLGLDAAASGASLTGSRILGGLKTVLLSSLNGGQGIGTLGWIKLTDGNGQSANVDLTGSLTLQDVVDRINSQVQAVGIRAEVNRAGNGVQLVDTTGASASPLTAANSNAGGNGDDGTHSAVKLGLATNSGPGTSTSGVLNSGDLHLRTISRSSQFSSLNGGGGVAKGSFTITDSAGGRATIAINSSMQTVGDVIDAINRNSTGVHADINATGDGIRLQDVAGGAGTLTVSEGGSTTAHDLNLLATVKTVSGTQTVDGTTTQTITLASGDTLTDLQNKINALSGGMSAGILNDGSNSPYRLSLSGTRQGAAGNMVVDTSQLGGMALQEINHGQDALLAWGSGGASSVVVASSSNKFDGVLPGVSLSIKNATGQPVSVNISSSDSDIAANLQTFVTNYNKFQTELATDTKYDTTTNTGAVLTSDGSALVIGMEMSNLITGSFGSGSLRTLADVGITVQSDGTLAFDQTRLDSAWANDPTAVKQLFTTKTAGIADQFNNLIEQLAGSTSSLLSTRISSLDDQISDNKKRIDAMNAQLDSEQNRLYTAFYNMDIAIGKLKNIQTVLNSLSPLDPYTGVASSSSSSSSSSSGG